MASDDHSTLLEMTSQASDSSRSLVAVVEEALEAQRALEHEVRVALGLNNTDFRALLTVFRRDRRGLPTHPRDLTQELGVGSGATSQVSGRLIAAGLLERADDPDDARAGLLSVTTIGRERLMGSTVELRAELNDLVAGLDTAEESRLIELLDRVRDIYHGHRRSQS